MSNILIGNENGIADGISQVYIGDANGKAVSIGKKPMSGENFSYQGNCYFKEYNEYFQEGETKNIEIIGKNIKKIFFTVEDESSFWFDVNTQTFSGIWKNTGRNEFVYYNNQPVVMYIKRTGMSEGFTLQFVSFSEQPDRIIFNLYKTTYAGSDIRILIYYIAD